MLIIDTDVAGLTHLAMDVDDDLALIMAFASRQRIAAITTTWGNAPEALCHTAAQRLLRRLNYDVPLYRGSECSMPLPHLCGLPSRTKASDMIGSIASSNPGRVTLVALGPLSNVAAALRDHPSLASDLVQIIIVGGSTDSNAGLARILASNFYWLPDLWSVRQVFSSHVAKTLVTVETMALASVDQQWLQSIEDSCCPHSLVCEYISSLRARGHGQVMRRLFPRDRFDASAWVPWDAIVMTLVQQPQLFREWRPHAVTVSWKGVVLQPLSRARAKGTRIEEEPWTVKLPTALNRTGVLCHVAASICSPASLEDDFAHAPWPVAWQNVPITMLNRGVRATMEPFDMFPGNGAPLQPVTPVGMVYFCGALLLALAIFASSESLCRRICSCFGRRLG